jgi:outer membrane receptor for Fe3+-dicitrate
VKIMKYRTGLIAGIACLVTTAGVMAADAEPAREKAEVQKKSAPDEAKCTQAPGSHIRLAKPENCAKAARGPYRSYSKEELERTGETNLAEALRKLDPTFH